MTATQDASLPKEDCPPPRSAPPAWIRVVLLVSGWLALAVGTAGIFLPILPTTPFIILAAACFSRGSRRTHAWILAHPWFGPTLREWQMDGTVPARVK